MKILKIEDQKGFFRVEEEGGWLPIDAIDKNALLKLLDLFLDKETQMDSPDEVEISNQAHSIIYKSLFEKLAGLEGDKDRFKDESERLYLEELRKYANA